MAFYRHVFFLQQLLVGHGPVLDALSFGREGEGHLTVGKLDVILADLSSLTLYRSRFPG